MLIDRHIITGEYPPDVGGVGDYTATLAPALVASGERVHVWCRGSSGDSSIDGVTVHRALGEFARRDLDGLSGALDVESLPRRLLVQWVPQAFGRRSLNIAFCRWLRGRRSAGDEIDVIVHEPFLPFRASPSVVAAAAIHRLMTVLLLRAATRVWVVTPAWARYLRPYAPARDLGFTWLPVPSTIPADAVPAGGVAAVRERLVPPDGFLLGAFATGGEYAERALRQAVLPLVGRRDGLHLLLIGRRSEVFRMALAEANPKLAPRIHATGCVSLMDLSSHVAACDAGVQPYADGVCGRQTSAMAFLAHGRPLVTTDGRFTEDVWRSGAVVLVSADAPDHITKALEDLLNQSGDRAHLARASRELYDAHFAVAHTATALHRAVS